MSHLKYMEMEDIAYKEWSDHLDLVASSRASPWLPAYGYHPHSPLQEIFQAQPEPFLSDSPSLGQQQYLALETIVEETSDDLCSESDKSGPTGWNSDSDADSVIHMPKTSENGSSWREESTNEEVPKKRRCRRSEKVSFSDDEEPAENVESTSLSSRSSSLLAFESLEKHCEDVFVTTATSNPFGSGIESEPTRWSHGRLSGNDEGDSSDEEFGFSSSVDTLHRCGSFRSSLPGDIRLRSYRSFDSLNLFEDSSSITYTMPELSQSQSALDYEKAKEEEKEYVIRNKKLTATTADLTTMSDPYDTGLYSPKHSLRKRTDASFHFKENFRNRPGSTERKSFSAEGLKLRPPIQEKSEETTQDSHGKSEPCLSLPPRSSVENLSEDSGFDDQVSAKGKLNLANFSNFVSSIVEDDYSSPSESSSSHYSDCNGSEGSSTSNEGREHSKFVCKNIASLKINAEQEQDASESFSEKDDVEVNFSPGETHMFNCKREEGLFRQGELENLIATPVTFAALDCKDSDESYLNVDVRPRPKFITFCKGNESESRGKIDLGLKRNSNEFFYETMNPKLEKGGAKRLPVLSTPNLLAGDDDFVRCVPSAASSLTHVPLKCFDGDEIDGGDVHQLLDIRKNQLSSGIGSQSSSGTKGVHFCPVVSEVSWQDSYSEDESSSASSEPSTDELSNRSLEELCRMENDDEEFLEVEEKSIPRYSSSVLTSAGSEEKENKGDNKTTKRNSGGGSEPSNLNVSSNENKAHVEKKIVTPPIHVTPTSSGHVLVGDPAQANAERRTRLSVSESSLPTEYHANDNQRDRFSPSSLVTIAPETGTMKKSKSRFGGFFERFSFRRRKTSAGNSKKQNGKKENEKKDKDVATVRHGNSQEDVTIIPLHGPENEAEVKEIVRSVVTPHVVLAKPPLPPNLQRMSGNSRKRSPSGTVSVGLQDDEVHEKENMPGIHQENSSPGHNYTDKSLSNAVKPVGLLETDLDTHITIESAGRRPLTQCNVASSKKARSLMNLGLGEMSVHREQEPNSPSGYLEPTHRSHGSVAVDDRAKSMEFLLDKGNQAAILPPENELQKGGTSERVMSEHQLRVQRSLQKLNIPDWYKTSAVAQTPQGFLLKREYRREHHGWPGLSSKTTSLSSLGSGQGASARSPTSHILSPSPTPYQFSRWSTSRLNSGLTSTSTSPSGSVRSSFNYRQPYLGWRSQERLTNPRTPAERLAAGLLPLQKPQNLTQYNSQSSVNPNLSDVRTSIKEVTSAIVHYVSGVQENGSRETLKGSNPGNSSTPSPRGSTGKLCWVESSFVGSKPVDEPETPPTLKEPIKPESRTTGLYLDLKSPSEVNHVTPHGMNEKTPGKSEEEGFEKAFDLQTRPSPSSTTLDDILESLLGLPPTSRSPSPAPKTAVAISPSRGGRPLLPVSDRQHQRHSCGDIQADVSESASDPGNSTSTKEVRIHRRKSDHKSEAGVKRHGSAERKKRHSSEEGGRREPTSTPTEPLVRCRYSKCGKTATVTDAKKFFKTCHNCAHVYCSRECRRAHWDKHRRTCLHSRVGSVCKDVFHTIKTDPGSLRHLSLIARRGYFTQGRGVVKVFFPDPEVAEKYAAHAFHDLLDSVYITWPEIVPHEMGIDVYTELIRLCKIYNPETRFILYVAVSALSEVPSSGAVKWERQIVSRCCKVQLDLSLLVANSEPPSPTPPPLPPRKTLSDLGINPKDLDNPDTLVLTSFPSVAGKLSMKKIREETLTNIVRELKQRGVNLKKQYPHVFEQLTFYVKGSLEQFPPTTIFPTDSLTGKQFMCIIMPGLEPTRLRRVKSRSRVKTINVGEEHKPSTPKCQSSGPSVQGGK